MTPATASYTQIDPTSIFQEGYELGDQSIIPNENIESSFVPFEDLVEFWVYDSNNVLLGGNANFQDYELLPSPKKGELEDSNTTELQVNPIIDVEKLGFDTGTLNTVYNFIKYELSSSLDVQYYIAEISSDRTEIRLKSNTLTNRDIKSSFIRFKSQLDSNEFFDEFYLNFGDNEYQIGINIELDASGEQNSILVKLYDALPLQFNLKDTVSVVSKVAESLAYNIEFPPIEEIITPNYIQGPNINLDIKDFVNNSTELKSKNELLNTESSASKDNLSYELNQKGVTITPNYSYNTFNEFVNFSSAKKRIQNFIEKLTQIQSYEDDIVSLTAITGSTSSSFAVSSSVASAYTNIENIIKNFDGYEYYLYYNSSSLSYPKSGSSFPYTPIDVNDVTASIWLGSDVEGSQYYGGILLSSSLYDNNNQNWLYYTIPEFIRENTDNDQYIEFTNMVGQHFDEIWLYTKAVSAKLNTTSDLNSGVPLELADDVITSLGYQGFGNNYNNQDNYIGLTGENNRSYVPPTGSELITNYIAVNGGSVINYWNINYSFLNYVEQLSDPGYPYAIDKVSKEIFKRLYHNMAYLVKKKGTITGLRQLINIWGIPNTIFRINEFGGKNKDNVDDYDMWYNRYSYAFHPVSTQNVASASVVFPWMPLERNRIADSKYIVPDSFQFRFKTTGYPSSQYAGDFFTQSLAVKKSDGDDTSKAFDFGVALFYTGSASGSYSGSSTSEYDDWGILRLYISGAAADGGTAVSDDIYLPFFNKGWWSVMVQRDTHLDITDCQSSAATYTLYAKNNIYNGFDGNQIGFQGSASIVSDISSSVNFAWGTYGTGSSDGIYLGGFVSGAVVGDVTIGEPGKIFSGSLQEFRYYAYAISESIFNDFVMNPESIEGINITGSLSSFDIVNFRAPLGNELENIFTSSLSSSYTESLTSLHPAITGSAPDIITGSFVNPVGDVTSSTYDIIYYENSTLRTFSKPNTEVYFLDQPSIGVRNRINNKIQVADGSDYGTVLSNQISIQQDYQISRSYTEDINSLEVAFSPQDEVNDDIIQSFGYGVVSDALADPRFISESLDYYPQLRKSAEYYFKKYTKGNVYDYLRLIKYFDNSIFKAIKSYVPARTSVSTGIVIKQHLLERNRMKPIQISELTQVAVTPSGGLNTPIYLENLELTASIPDPFTFDGGAGGVVNQFNYNGSPNFNQTPITQSWTSSIAGKLGLVTEIDSTQEEFFDGEYSGSEFAATTQSLNPDNIYKPSNAPATSSTFLYSDFNPIINNYNANRPSTFVQNVEYNNGIGVPSNLSAILSKTATPTETPDSNYTSKQVTIPRYDGTRMESADYNFFTNGDTIGNKLGKVAVVDKRPIYFAHFKSSVNSPTRFGTTKFNIDSLIEAPFEPVTGKNIIPNTIQVNGDNENLYEVVSTFEPGRKLSIYYNTDFLNGVDYSKLKTGSFTIYNPGSEFKATSGNQRTTLDTSVSWSYTRFNSIISGSNPNNEAILLRTGSGYLELWGSGSDFNQYVYFTDALSGIGDAKGGGVGYMGYGGSVYLATIHTYNYCLANGIIYSYSTPPLNFPQPLGVVSSLDSGSDFNYFKWLPSQSLLPQYEDFQEPFLVEKEDIIRITYRTTGSVSIPDKTFTIDFEVMDVTSSVYQSGSSDALAFEYSDNGSAYASGSVTVKLFNKLVVNPDPSTLTNQIPNGEIYSFTHIKRSNSDDRVIATTRIPSGSDGNLTPSGEGFIIPNDLTNTQKRNVLTIINQLKSQNTLLGD
jgi:hypothetical protein